MPTDLPPDYVPKPAKGPDSPSSPGQETPGGPTMPPGQGGDVVDPPGWQEPAPLPGDVPSGVPTPAGTPTF